MATVDERLLIDTTYPGQPKAIIGAPRHILEHYRKRPDSDLPLIQPVDRLKEVFDQFRVELKQNEAAAKKHQEKQSPVLPHLLGRESSSCELQNARERHRLSSPPRRRRSRSRLSFGVFAAAG